ncbi:MAG: hypothetical protein ABSG67_16875 [Thermoguttaceae bacterium]
MVFFIVGFILGIIMGLIGPINPTVPVLPLASSWGDLLVCATKVGLYTAIIIYIWQVLYGKHIFSIMSQSNNVLICEKCFKVKAFDGQQSCDCGGKFENFDLWKWDD